MKAAVIVALAVLATGPLTAVAQEGAGSCSYIQKNMFAGPFKVCDQPVDAAKCEELGKTDENSDAAYAAGSCPSAGLVGTCDMGDNGQRLYYEGDPGGLEIGCGFQGGEWKTAQ